MSKLNDNPRVLLAYDVIIVSLVKAKAKLFREINSESRDLTVCWPRN